MVVCQVPLSILQNKLKLDSWIMCTHVKEGSGNSSTLSPTPLWKMANVPSERPTSTRPFTCLWEEMCENYMFKQANMKEINSSCHLSECTYTMPSTESFSFIE